MKPVILIVIAFVFVLGITMNQESYSTYHQSEDYVEVIEISEKNPHKVFYFWESTNEIYNFTDWATVKLTYPVSDGELRTKNFASVTHGYIFGDCTSDRHVSSSIKQDGTKWMSLKLYIIQDGVRLGFSNNNYFEPQSVAKCELNPPPANDSTPTTNTPSSSNSFENESTQNFLDPTFEIVNDVYIVYYKVYVEDPPSNTILNYEDILNNSFSFWEEQELSTNNQKAKMKFESTKVKQGSSLWITWDNNGFDTKILGEGELKIPLGFYDENEQFQLYDSESMEIILKHNLGHGIGLKHVYEEDNIMHPLSSILSSKTTIPENTQSPEIVENIPESPTVNSKNELDSNNTLCGDGMFSKDGVCTAICGDGTYFEDGKCKLTETSTVSSSESGGCLIATATYGSELAPQVQQLRELRDNSLLQTESGTSFMNTFNDVYYSFSPVIADYERENPVFKEAVKITITPLLSSLSILNHVDMDSEAEVLGYGISLIVLNLGMYFVAPVIVIHKIRKFTC